MNKIGIGIDYSNICKDYNTSYLDRDNNDPATTKCMKEVTAWISRFLSNFLNEFDYKIFKLNSSVNVTLDEIVSNRFLFYSLEKEITLQNYVMQKDFTEYNSLTNWADVNTDGILIRNDEDGEGVYIYLTKDSKEYGWLIENLNGFLVDEVPFNLK